MSVDLEYTPAAVDLAQLHQELLRASLTPEAVRSGLVEVADPPPAGPPDLQTYQYVLTVFLTMPDGTVEGDVDTVVAAHVPMERYDPTTKMADLARTREAARLRADYERLLVLYRAVGAAAAVVNPHLAALLEEATVATIEVLKRRDRAAGLY